MNYFISTFGIWKNNIATKFHKIFIKKYWKFSRWELVFGDPLEKSILAVARMSDKFIRNQKIKYFLLVGEYHAWLNEGFKKKWKFEFLAELYAKQYDFR